MNKFAWRAAIVTHTDLDGVASAAIYLRLAGLELGRDACLHFAEPYKLHKVLKSLVGVAEKLVVLDLGPNADTLEDVARYVREAVQRGSRVEWYDHHRWQPEWIELMKGAGAELVLDVSTCTAGVVVKYASSVLKVEPDDYSVSLASAACAADLWRWDHPLAGKLFRVVDRYKGAKGDAWKRELIRSFREGRLWWPELDEALQEYLKREFEGIKYSLKNSVVLSKAGCRFVVALKKPGPPSASIVGNMLLSRFNADFVAIVRTRGRGMSLRSRSVDVRVIALRMGGGGHPRAAGAPLKAPLLLSLAALVVPRLKLRWAARRLMKALEELGSCPSLEE